MSKIYNTLFSLSSVLTGTTGTGTVGLETTSKMLKNLLHVICLLKPRRHAKKAGLWIRIHLNPDPDPDPAFFLNPDPVWIRFWIRIRIRFGFGSRFGLDPDSNESGSTTLEKRYTVSAKKISTAV
jgi:hypothetical protein